MRCAPLLLAACLLGGCDHAGDTAARMLARQQAVDPPQLWLVEPLDAKGAAQGPSYVCADTRMSEGFARTRAEIDGAPCQPTAREVVKPGMAALRCEAGGRSFAFTTASRGDPSRAFELTVAVTPLDRSLGRASRTTRFRRLGACPAGWRIGDERAPRA